MFRPRPDCLLCLLALWLVVAPAPAADEDYYAALAFSPRTGRWGQAYGCTSREQAERTALKHCDADDARVLTCVHNGYCALALGNGAYGYATGRTAGEAKAAALDQCLKRTRRARVVACARAGSRRATIVVHPRGPNDDVSIGGPVGGSWVTATGSKRVYRTDPLPIGEQTIFPVTVTRIGRGRRVAAALSVAVAGGEEEVIDLRDRP